MSLCLQTPISTLEDSVDPSAPPLSKNQLKKKLKMARWEAAREDRKRARKLKQTEKRMKEREQKNSEEQKFNNNKGCIDSLGLSDVSIANTPSAKIKKEPSRTANINCIIDCDFDEFMLDKEVASLGAQVTRCYSSNRKAQCRVNLTISSVNKRLLDRLQIMHGESYKCWKHVRISPHSYGIEEQQHSNGTAIYLTSDSPQTLHTLEEGNTYIIGGIVDRNRHKGICYNKAISQNLRTGKLPIDDFIKMSSRLVLTTNQVFEIMLRWLETQNWERAFLEVIPPRKNPEKRQLNYETPHESSPGISGVISEHENSQ